MNCNLTHCLTGIHIQSQQIVLSSSCSSTGRSSRGTSLRSSGSSTGGRITESDVHETIKHYERLQLHSGY